MDRLTAATKLIKITAYANLTRAAVLESNDKETLVNILKLRAEIALLSEQIIANDETTVYLAK